MIDPDGEHTSTVYCIGSPVLREFLVELHKDVQGLDICRVKPECSPELMFYSYHPLKDKLDSENKNEPANVQLCEHLGAALHVIEEDLQGPIREVPNLIRQNIITFDLLWAIFKPNTIIYNRDKNLGQDRLLRLRQIDPRCSDKCLCCTCDIINDDGKEWGLANIHFHLEEFSGVRKITDLEYYPLQFHVDKDELYARAVQLGKEFVASPPHMYREYTGIAMREKSYIAVTKKFFTQGRIMISPSAFHRYEPDSVYNPRVHRPLQKTGLSEEEYAICTPILLGFSFSVKSWAAFGRSIVQEVQWNDDAFPSLVLGQNQKTLIHGLVQSHATADGGFDDVIQHKGRGLIGLLAGSPGCGKTLTAEAVAETTRRPLYAISAGDLGTTPSNVETNLRLAFDLAKMWGAVILLDEAEVFLQQRRPSDLKRNALVSIFLRHLEYYEGIMFLTTNMVGECDLALESRIHIHIRFPDLNFDSRKAIWRTFTQRAGLQLGDAELDQLAAHEINGRQIKNAVGSAQTLTLAKGGVAGQLDLEDVNVVLGVLKDWQSE